MVTRHYKCSTCTYECEKLESVSTQYLTQCPECGEPLNQVFYPVTGLVKGRSTTLGSYMDSEYKRLGQNEIAERAAAAKLEQDTKYANRLGVEVKDLPKKERPFWRTTDKIDTSLANMTPEKQAHYVLTGEK
jgi:predicted nucleic acid-binding Zn ribbon protein